MSRAARAGAVALSAVGRHGRRPESGFVLVGLVVVVLVIFLVGASASWTLRCGTTTLQAKSSVTRRADQFARAAVAEAAEQLRRLVNLPRPEPGQPPEAIENGWFRAVRPPASMAAQPGLTRETLSCPMTRELARPEGLEVTEVVARCVTRPGRHLLGQGVIELTVSIRSTGGPVPIHRKLVERRGYYLVPAGSPDVNAPTIHRCEILVTPIARLYASS